MVGHEGILEQAEGGMYLRQPPQSLLYAFSCRRGNEIGAAGTARRNSAVAAEPAEAFAAGSFQEGYMVDSPGAVVMPSGPVVTAPLQASLKLRGF